MLISNSMALSFIILSAFVAVHGKVNECPDGKCDVVRFPLLDSLQAPLVAQLDLSNLNAELKRYIDSAINGGIETSSLELKNKTDKLIEEFKSVSKLFFSLLGDLRESVAKLRNDLDKMAPREKGSTSYTQWGRTTCTSNTSTLVYSGFVGGSSYTAGGAPNKLCLPNEPQWGLYDRKDTQNMPFIGGTVYHNYDIDLPNSLFDKSYSYFLVQCAVCQTNMASSILMIPGTTECFGDWNMEYKGYLFAGYPSHKAASEFICVDENPDFKRKLSSWTDKSILYAVHAKCNDATPCPPYVNGREMACVVCSR